MAPIVHTTSASLATTARGVLPRPSTAAAALASAAALSSRRLASALHHSAYKPMLRRSLVGGAHYAAVCCSTSSEAETIEVQLKVRVHDQEGALGQAVGGGGEGGAEQRRSDLRGAMMPCRWTAWSAKAAARAWRRRCRSCPT